VAAASLVIGCVIDDETGDPSSFVAAYFSSVHASADCYGSETTLCSQIFYGSGVCDGIDQVPILERPWEPVAIEIVGVTVGLKIWGAGERGYIFAGNSYSPDCHVVPR